MNVNFIRPNEPITVGGHRGTYKVIEGIDLFSLPERKTVILDMTMTILGEFNTPMEAAIHAGITDISSHNLTNFVNKKRVLNSPVLGQDIYLASNPNSRSMASGENNTKPVRVHDTRGIEPDLVLPSVIKLAKHFGLRGGSSICHKVDSGQLYRHRYIITSE